MRKKIQLKSTANGLCGVRRGKRIARKSVQTILIGFLNCEQNQFKLQCQVEICFIFFASFPFKL